MTSAELEQRSADDALRFPSHDRDVGAPLSVESRAANSSACRCRREPPVEAREMANLRNDLRREASHHAVASIRASALKLSTNRPERRRATFESRAQANQHPRVLGIEDHDPALHLEARSREGSRGRGNQGRVGRAGVTPHRRYLWLWVPQELEPAGADELRYGNREQSWPSLDGLLVQINPALQGLSGQWVVEAQLEERLCRGRANEGGFVRRIANGHLDHPVLA